MEIDAYSVLYYLRNSSRVGKMKRSVFNIAFAACVACGCALIGAPSYAGFADEPAVVEIDGDWVAINDDGGLETEFDSESDASETASSAVFVEPFADEAVELETEVETAFEPNDSDDSLPEETFELDLNAAFESNPSESAPRVVDTTVEYDDSFEISVGTDEVEETSVGSNDGDEVSIESEKVTAVEELTIDEIFVDNLADEEKFVGGEEIVENAIVDDTANETVVDVEADEFFVGEIDAEETAIEENDLDEVAIETENSDEVAIENAAETLVEDADVEETAVEVSAVDEVAIEDAAETLVEVADVEESVNEDAADSTEENVEEFDVDAVLDVSSDVVEEPVANAELEIEGPFGEVVEEPVNDAGKFDSDFALIDVSYSTETNVADDEAVDLDYVFEDDPVVEANENKTDENEIVDDASELALVEEPEVPEADEIEIVADEPSASEPIADEPIADEDVEEIAQDDSDQDAELVVDEADAEEAAEPVFAEPEFENDEAEPILDESADANDSADKEDVSDAELTIEEAAVDESVTTVEETSVESADLGSVEVENAGESVVETDADKTVAEEKQAEIATSEWVAGASSSVENNDVSEISTPLADELWIVMSNGCGFFCQVYENNAWRQASVDEFYRGDSKDRTTIFWAHGFQTDMNSASRDLFCTYNAIDRARAAVGQGRSCRLVVWKWASERTSRRILADAMQKERLADIEGVSLARFIGGMRGNNDVSLIGFSFGARVVGSALQTLACRQNSYMDNKTGKISLVLASPACDCGAFSSVYARGAKLPSYVLNLYNPADGALRFYPAASETGSSAQGVCPIDGTPFTGAYGQTFNMNVNSVLRREHSYSDEIQSLPANVLIDALF